MLISVSLFHQQLKYISQNPNLSKFRRSDSGYFKKCEFNLIGILTAAKRKISWYNISAI